MSITEGRQTGEFLGAVANGNRSFEEIVLEAGQGTLQAGLILGKITASGTYAPFDSDAVDGTEAVAGILYNTIDVHATVDTPATMVVRDCEVLDHALSTADSGDLAAGKAGLAPLNIIVRS